MSAISAIVSPILAGLQLGAGVGAKKDADAFADMLRTLGADEKTARQRASTKLLGDIRASYAASNVNPFRGSPLDVLAESAIFEALNAEKAEFAFELRARRAEMEGIANLMAGVSGAFGTIVGGIEAWQNLPDPTATVGGTALPTFSGTSAATNPLASSFQPGLAAPEIA